MARINRNTLRTLVRPERLEDRRCFNVDIGLGDGGAGSHTFDSVIQNVVLQGGV